MNEDQEAMISTYCGSMTEEALREHVSGPNACEPCANAFPEYIEEDEAQ